MPVKKINKYCNLSNGTTIVELNRDLWTILDTEDWDKIKHINWYAHFAATNNSFYVWGKIYISKIRKNVNMHRIILNVTDPKIQVDHIYHDTLDNRKINLRIDIENKNHQNTKKPKHNTSGYKGVCWNKWAKKWHVGIKVKNKIIRIGYFDNLIEGALAYDKASILYHGEYALLNFS